MISETDLRALILKSFPAAEVEVFDINGMSDHFRIWVSSVDFTGKNSIQRHQMVYKAVKPAYEDGRLHAVEITTDVPPDSGSS